MAKGNRRNALADDQRGYMQQMINDGEQARREAAGHSDGRGRAGHGQAQHIDKRGIAKATYNLPKPVIQQVKALAQEMGCPQNDIALAALTMLLNRIEQEPGLLDELKIPANQLNYAWRLEIPEDFRCQAQEYLGPDPES